MSKHTPGPWEWIGNNSLYGGAKSYEEILSASDDGAPHGWHSAFIEHHYDAEQAEANKLLIACAPELLEALRICCELIEGEGIEPPGNARAIIAKAEGA